MAQTTRQRKLRLAWQTDEYNFENTYIIDACFII